MRWRPRQSKAAKAYQSLLSHDREWVRLMLADLRAAGYANESTFVEGDPTATAYNEGRRSMWLHIREMLALTDRDIEELENWEIQQRQNNE